MEPDLDELPEDGLRWMPILAIAGGFIVLIACLGIAWVTGEWLLGPGGGIVASSTVAGAAIYAVLFLLLFFATALDYSANRDSQDLAPVAIESVAPRREDHGTVWDRDMDGP